MAQFDRHWADVFGDRWPQLRASLKAPTDQVAWENPFLAAASDSVRAALGDSDWQELRHTSGCTLWARLAADEPGAPLPQPTRPEGAALMGHYGLDGASPLPAIALAPRRGHRVLDLCAAPGGKSLVLAGQMFAGAAPASAVLSPTVLISNDRSGPRRARLRRVLEECVLGTDRASFLASLFASFAVA